jgi:hypothetical protein
MNKIAVIAVALVAALVFAATNSTATTSDASHCQYGLLYRGWHGVHGAIYLRLTITPRNPLACGNWNDKYFGGSRMFRRKLGTGVTFCKLLAKTGSQTTTVAVFADTSKAGRTFCRVFHPSWPRL